MIVVRKLSKTYSNGAQALKDVTFAVRPGEFVFLVGPNGAGKSTLFKIMLRAEDASAGCVLMNGIDVCSLRKEQLAIHRRRLGTVFQDPKLLPRKTIFENVALPLEADGVDRTIVDRRVREALELAGLEDQDTRFPEELSGGQQQQAAIARALAHTPEVILADEPTGNLSPTASSHIMDVLARINSRGITVIVATHSRETVDSMRRRVVALQAGRVIWDIAHGVYPDVLLHAA